MERVQKKNKTGRGSLIWWIFSCMAVLAGLFVIITWSTQKEAVLTIPISPHALEEGLILTGPPLKGVEIRVKGPESVIDNIQTEQPVYDLSLEGVKVGFTSIPVDDSKIRLPKSIKLLKPLTESITVHLEKEIKKKVTVSPLMTGEPAPGYKIRSVEIKPSEIIIRGPENLLADMSQIPTMQIDVTGIKESFKKEIAFNLPEDADTDHPLKIAKIEVNIIEQIETRKFPDVPVHGKGGKQNYSISPNRIHLEISGPLLTLDKLQAEKKLTAYVDLENLGPGVYVRRASIPLPLKTSLIRVEPEVFTITIK